MHRLNMTLHLDPHALKLNRFQHCLSLLAELVYRRFAPAATIIAVHTMGVHGLAPFLQKVWYGLFNLSAWASPHATSTVLMSFGNFQIASRL